MLTGRTLFSSAACALTDFNVIISVCFAVIRTARVTDGKQHNQWMPCMFSQHVKKRREVKRREEKRSSFSGSEKTEALTPPLIDKPSLVISSFLSRSFFFLIPPPAVYPNILTKGCKEDDGQSDTFDSFHSVATPRLVISQLLLLLCAEDKRRDVRLLVYYL